jgi:hypothetical protein
VSAFTLQERKKTEDLPLTVSLRPCERRHYSRIV